MKKALSLLLVFVMLLSLCACGKDDAQNTDPSTPTSQVTTEGTEKPTDSTEGTTDATQAPTEEPTTPPTEAPTTPPTTPPATCSHSWKNATCTAPKTCTKCGVTDGKAAGHNWKNATCTAPKTCSKCGATDGKAAGHNYQNGTCTLCGEADPAAAVVGEWFLEGVNNSATEYETMHLTLGEGTAFISIAYFGKLEYDSQQMLDEILANGCYETEDGFMYYHDILQYNGVYYHSAMYGLAAEGTYTVSGNTITIALTNHYGISGNLVLTKTSASTLSFVSAGEVFDSTICEVLNNGRVFTKIG